MQRQWYFIRYLEQESKDINELDSHIEEKLVLLKEQFGQNPALKVSLSKDLDCTPTSKNDTNKDGNQKTKLSKRDSVFFKPTEKTNKFLGELLIKVKEID